MTEECDRSSALEHSAKKVRTSSPSRLAVPSMHIIMFLVVSVSGWHLHAEVRWTGSEGKSFPTFLKNNHERVMNVRYGLKDLSGYEHRGTLQVAIATRVDAGDWIHYLSL